MRILAGEHGEDLFAGLRARQEQAAGVLKRLKIGWSVVAVTCLSWWSAGWMLGSLKDENFRAAGATLILSAGMLQYLMVIVWLHWAAATRALEAGSGEPGDSDDTGRAMAVAAMKRDHQLAGIYMSAAGMTLAALAGWGFFELTSKKGGAEVAMAGLTGCVVVVLDCLARTLALGGGIVIRGVRGGKM